MSIREAFYQNNSFSLVGWLAHYIKLFDSWEKCVKCSLYRGKTRYLQVYVDITTSISALKWV